MFKRFQEVFFQNGYLPVFAVFLACYLLFSPSANLVDVEGMGFHINDKVAHGIVFTGLSFLWTQYKRKPSFTVGFLLIFAVFTEIVQYLLPESFSRSFELKDLLADSVGIALGILLSYTFDRLVK